MYQMEIERVRYSLARYLRTRLLKIEKGLDFITGDIELMDRYAAMIQDAKFISNYYLFTLFRLSFEEKTFASNLKDLVNSLFENSFASRLAMVDEGLQRLLGKTDDRQQHAKATVQVIEHKLCE